MIEEDEEHSAEQEEEGKSNNYCTHPQGSPWTQSC